MSAISPPDDVPAISADILMMRAEWLARLRQFFTQRHFLEVETPVLSRDTVVDRHLDPFVVSTEGALHNPAKVAPSSGLRYLQTSPEFGMKRLLLLPELTAIFQLAKVFRQGEVGPLHNPEFTMLEWYRVGDDYAAGMDLLAELAQFVFPLAPCARLSYGTAFKDATGVCPHTGTVNQLRQCALKLHLAPPPGLGDDQDGWLDYLLTELVQPRLGVTVPVILYDFPASQAALARVRPDQPPVAERFELYYRGIELANGYHELLDPAILRQRIERNNELRVADGKPPLPGENRLLAAMERGIPPCSGCALGVDRLLMLLVEGQSLASVLPFPWDRA
ncbi:MAG: EF-P lysine aminoacylase EpmA [Pirellulales bacterium]|nr:EF-P lysine aminoacylase EpmA [Pirellulales bacterium]